MSVGSRTAVATSVVLHGLALVAVWHVEAKAQTRATERVRFDLIVRTPPPVPSPAPLPPPPKPAQLPPRLPTRSARATPPKIAQPEPAPAPAPSPKPPPPEQSETVPVAPTPPAPKVDLFAPEALSHAADQGVEIPDLGRGRHSDFSRLPGEAAGERATNEADRVASRVRGATMDLNARERVQTGLVDPSYARMGRAFVDAWDPDRALPETSAELWVKRRAQNAVVSTRLWQEAGANYAKTGSAMAPGETLEKVKDVRPEAALGLGTDGRRQTAVYRQYMNGKFNSGRSAHVLVEEDVERVRVSLVQSSGDIDLDRAALEDIRTALVKMRADHPAQQQRRKSLWMMRLLVLINPPVPVVGISFDEVIQKPRIELPLDRHLFKHVELEAVYDDDARFDSSDAGPPP